jgi:hypothetical protein
LTMRNHLMKPSIGKVGTSTATAVGNANR